MPALLAELQVTPPEGAVLPKEHSAIVEAAGDEVGAKMWRWS